MIVWVAPEIFLLGTVDFEQGAIFLFKGGFPLSRNFYVRTDVNFNWLYVRKLKQR